MLDLLTIAILAPPLGGVLLHMRTQSQKAFDADKQIFKLDFPKGLKGDQLDALLRSISENLRDNALTGDPSVTFEVRSSAKGIEHFMRIPSRDVEYGTSQLRGFVPGITIEPIDKEPDIAYDQGVSIIMTDPERILPIANTEQFTSRLLNSLGTTGRELVTVQWNVYHTSRSKVTGSGAGSSVWKTIFFGSEASQDQPADVKQKVAEQTFSVVGRVAARADDDARAKALVNKVFRALASESGSGNKLKPRAIPFSKLDATVNGALTPLLRSNTFTITELSAHIGWPIGDPQVAGLTQGSAIRIAPAASVSQTGRLLGWSNIPGNDCPIAQAYEYADLNTLFVGMIGSGKSVGMANFIYDDMQAGHGCIVIDASSSRSTQSLSSRALEYVPRHRLNDVIYIDVLGDADNPVSFNPLDQGYGLGAVDLIEGVMTSLYPDIANGVSVRDLLHHGLWTIVAHGGLSLVDLGALIRPKPSERAWADGIINGVKDPDLREFWERMAEAGRGNPSKQDKWDRYTEPLFRRLWQLTGRPEIRNMIGQSTNALNWEEALTKKKIVIISLAGLPSDSAELLGSMLVQTLWTTAQRFSPPKGEGTGLFLDEFQVTANIKEGIGDMLNRGRKHGLWMTLGTQFLSDLPSPTKNSILNNVGTRVVYRTSADEAFMWRKQFGMDRLRETDFQNGREYEALAQIPDPSGRPTVTLKARPPAPATGFGQQAADLSRQRFGRPVESVRHEITERRKAKGDYKPKRPPMKPGDAGTFDPTS